MSNIKRYNGTSWETIQIMADKATADVYGNNISTTYAKKADVYTKTETDTKLSAKQDKLVSGTNIKTINGSSILGSGNVTISASVPTASSTTLGGIKIGFNNPSDLSAYPVQLDASNKAYVNIPIYYYEGTTYGECYEIDAPSYEYSMAIGTSGFTVDSGVPGGATMSSNILQVDSDKFQYMQSDVMTGATKYLQSKYFKHWYGTFVCPSNTYYYRLIAKAKNSGSDSNLCQTITIRGTIGGWWGHEQCEFMYTVALRSSSFSTENNIRKTIFRGSNPTLTESAIASNGGIDIVTHRNSSSGALYVYLRAYGTQKYSQYDIIVTADGWGDVVELPTDENFDTSSSGTLVSGSQLLSDTQNQCIEITNKNLQTVNGYSLMGDGNLIIQDQRIKDHTSTDTTGYVFSSYCVIGNMQICWGHVNSSSGSASVTVNVNFPLSFSGNPVVFVQSYNAAGSPTSEKESTTSQTMYRNAQSIRQVTSTLFKFDTGNAEAHGYSWIAIGRYKGSGA